MPVIIKNGVRCTEHKDIADSFNDFFFANFGKQLASNFNDVATESMHVQSNNSECKFSFHDFDDEFLLKKLLSLDVKNATGLDGISAKLLKIGAPCIFRSLTYIMNRSL